MPDALHSSRIYREAMRLGDLVTEEVRRWAPRHQRTIGGQFERAANSVGANFAESFGRFSPADKRLFVAYALGSARESSTWFAKSAKLHLVSAEKYHEIDRLIDSLLRRLSA